MRLDQEHLRHALDPEQPYYLSVERLDETALGLLEELIAGPDVRLAMRITELAEHVPGRAGRRLLEYAVRSPRSAVREVAAAVLGRRFDLGVGPLRMLLRDREPRVRERAAVSASRWPWFRRVRLGAWPFVSRPVVVAP